MIDISLKFILTVCSGHLCDGNRCIPKAWRCDGHVDCSDQSDEQGCNICGKDSVYCGDRRCMSSKHVCDGEINCPYGQDERNCSKFYLIHKLKRHYYDLLTNFLFSSFERT